MTTFKYIAKAEPTEQVTGTIEADSAALVAHILRKQGMYALRIEAETSDDRKLSVFKQLALRKVGTGVLSGFTEQFANLLDAGVPLERALKLLGHQMSNPLLKAVLAEITEMVRSGRSLAEALSDYPKIFSTTYVSMIRVGEETGLLASMLTRLSKSLDDESQLRSKIKSALVYPVFLVLVGLSTVIVLMVWVIPKFSSFFTSLEHQLPLPTRIVIELSSIMARIWPFLLVLIVLFVLIILRLLKNKTVRFAFDRFCLRLPLIGEFIIKSQLAQFMRTLGILLTQGINMLNALNIAANTLSNKFIISLVCRAQSQIADGRKLHECFTDSRIFSDIVLGVMSVGQESGTLPQMLIRVSEQYERQTERQLKTLTTMIEPVMILVMGSIVGFVVVSMLMPIFKVSSLVQ